MSLAPIAKPLAGKKLCKRTLKLVRRGIIHSYQIASISDSDYLDCLLTCLVFNIFYYFFLNFCEFIYNPIHFGKKDLSVSLSFLAFLSFWYVGFPNFYNRVKIFFPPTYGIQLLPSVIKFLSFSLLWLWSSLLNFLYLRNIRFQFVSVQLY